MVMKKAGASENMFQTKLFAIFLLLDNKKYIYVVSRQTLANITTTIKLGKIDELLS